MRLRDLRGWRDERRGGSPRKPPKMNAKRAIEDEEALAESLSATRRKERGAWFTPAPLAQRVLDVTRPFLPPRGPARVVDPACGAGAFLSLSSRHFPAALQLGLELDPDDAAGCRERLPRAHIIQGDAFRGGLEVLLPPVDPEAFELWVGNPPYNGTSSVLRDPSAYARLRALLPGPLPRGTSLRDDYAFFLLVAAERLAVQPGALAFITSATLLDAFLYAPLRRHLLKTLELCAVELFEEGAFRGTRVRTCLTIWRSRKAGRLEVPPTYAAPGVAARSFTPAEPELLLRPAAPAAEALDAAWRAQGEPLDLLVPVSFTGLKTRFDELLVDADASRLEARVRAFLEASHDALPTFAERFGIPSKLLPKLEALKAYAEQRGAPSFDPGRIHPFLRFAGPRHADGIPAKDRAFCYLERRLIPRGDHRLQGAWNPHAEPTKLVFNLRERPLVACALDTPGCVTAWRHSRFAPLHVPDGERGRRRINLSERGLLTAKRLGGPEALFRAIARFIQSPPVQEVWAPDFATSRVLPIPLDALQADGTWTGG